MTTTPLPWGFSAAGDIHYGSWEDMADRCLESGLAGIEMADHFFFGKSNEDARKVGELFRSKGLKLNTYHLPLNLPSDITALYETDRRKAVDIHKAEMEKATALGAHIGILHPGVCRYNFETEGEDRLLAQMAKSIAELVPHAESLGFTLAIENLPGGPERKRYGTRPEQFVRFRKEFDHPNIGFCYDTGHGLIALNDHALDFLDIMGDKLVAYHLNDNAGDRDSHLAPGRGRVNFKGVFAHLFKTGFKGVACLECPPFAYGPRYDNSAWKQFVDDTNALALPAKP